ncbi:hypothetical protein Sm713_62950 [Streptomyces sp. TS71-3]|nr:hypothetical protein Sm713_62950 [Streptomyces sp. TS71-3]
MVASGLLGCERPAGYERIPGLMDDEGDGEGDGVDKFGALFDEGRVAGVEFEVGGVSARRNPPG